MLATRPTVRAYYVLSVRQFAVLPPPSFRPVLADDPLDLANSSDCRACSGLSPYRFCPCWAHNNKAARKGGPFPKWILRPPSVRSALLLRNASIRDMPQRWETDETSCGCDMSCIRSSTGSPEDYDLNMGCWHIIEDVSAIRNGRSRSRYRLHNTCER